MIETLLATAPPDPMISGNWIIAVIGAITAAAAALMGKRQGIKQAQRTTLESPVPEVPIKKNYSPPSWDAHCALVDRVTAVEQMTQELRRDVAAQYREIMAAGATREANLSDKLDGIARGIHSRIDDILKMKGGTR